MNPPSLAERLLRFGGSPLVRAAILVVLGNLLLWASARAQIPMWPVPMTMQTLVVLLIGAAYGSRLGALTVALYLLEGAAGLPVFANTPERGIGLAYMMGPTGGFLVGFLFAAWATGFLVERGWGGSLARLCVPMAVGTVLPFVTGVAWLATLVGAGMAVSVGLLPFLAGAAVKLALGVAMIRALEMRLEFGERD